MIIRIPSDDNREWTGIFQGTERGSLWSTFNIDLERNPPLLCLSQPIKIISRDSDTSFSTPLQFLKTTAESGGVDLVALTRSKILFTTPTSITNWTGDTHTGSPSSADTNPAEEIIVFGDSDISGGNGTSERLFAFLKTDIAVLNSIDTAPGPHSWDTSWWVATKGQPALAATWLGHGSFGHPAARQGKLLAFGDRNKINTIDGTNTIVNPALTFDEQWQARCIYSEGSGFWIGIEHSFREGTGSIIFWDGFSRSYNNEYLVYGIPLCGFFVDGTPYFVLHNGLIMSYNGGGFSEVARFPNYEMGVSLDIWRHGAVYEGGLVKLLVRFDSNSTRLSDGVWLFNPSSKNLYHSRAVSDTTLGSSMGKLSSVGGLFNVSGASYSFSNSYLVGASYYRNYSDTTSIKNIIAGAQNIPTSDTSALTTGYFITTPIHSSQIANIWEKIWVKFRRFRNSTNRIFIKYRTDLNNTDGGNIKNNPETIITGSWSDTSTIKIGSYSGDTTIRVGEEIHIVTGPSNGIIGHITSKTDSDSTITIDKTQFISDTGAILAYIDNWTLLGEISDTTMPFNHLTIIGSDSDGNSLNTSEWIQFKVVLYGNPQSMEFQRLLIEAKDAFNLE